MSINSYANEVFDRLNQEPNAIGANNIHHIDKIKILDIGINTIGGWSSAKALIEALIGGLGYLSFGELNIGKLFVPTVDLFLDSPIKVCLESLVHEWDFAGIKVIGPGNKEEELTFGFIETEEIPTTIDTNLSYNFLVASNKSLVSSVYNSATAIPKVISKLKKLCLPLENIFWAWGTCPLAIMSDDLELMKKRKINVLKYGAVVSIWVRESDNRVEQVVRNWEGLGELRIHNLGSGKTFIGGKTDVNMLI